MPYEAKKGDYVSWKSSAADDAETFYGQVTAVAKNKDVTIKKADEETAESPAQQSNFHKLAKSAWARMKIRAKPNFRELAENVAFASAYHPLIMKNSIMGAENISFLLADATHEFLLKGFAEQIMDMLKPTSLTKDGDAFFQMADISDSLRKVPFVVGLQQVFQRILYKKGWGHQIVSNLLGGTGVLYASNVADRMFYSEDGKYTYP